MAEKFLCPSCRAEIPLDDVNVSKNIALCRQCGKTWDFAELTEDTQASDVDTNRPPSGAWYRQMPPRQFEVGSTTRSPAAFFLVPFMCVWSGLSMSGIYGTQIIKGHFNPIMSLFGLPFLIGTIVLLGASLMCIFGKIVVRVDGNSGVIFNGIGPIGWRRRFQWDRVTAIRLTQAARSDNSNKIWYRITLDGDKPINFASAIKRERLDFIAAVLRKKWQESGYKPKLAPK
jgi:hypothetical protein